MENSKPTSNVINVEYGEDGLPVSATVGCIVTENGVCNPISSRYANKTVDPKFYGKINVIKPTE